MIKYFSLLICLFLFLVYGTSTYCQVETSTLRYKGNEIEIQSTTLSDEKVKVSIENKSSDKKDILNIYEKLTEYQFVELLKKEIEETCEMYYLSFTDTIKVGLSKTDVSIAKVQESIKNLSEDTLRFYLKSSSEFVAVIDSLDNAFGNTEDSKELSYDFLDESGTTVFKFTIKRDGGKKIKMTDNSYADYSSDNLLKIIVDKVKNSDPPLSFLFNEKWFDSNVDFSFSISNIRTIEEFYSITFSKIKYEFLGSYKFIDKSNSAKSEIYEVKILRNLKDETFKLRVCSEPESKCFRTNSMPFLVSDETLEQSVNKAVGGLNTNYGIENENWKELRKAVFSSNQKNLVKEQKKKDELVLDSLLRSIDAEGASFCGELKLHEKIQLKVEIPSDEFLSRSKTASFEYSFKPSYAQVRMFNNRAKNVVLVGDVLDENNNIIEEGRVLVNHQYSLPVRSFVHAKQTISFTLRNGYRCELDYNKAFTYFPLENVFNYSVKNRDYYIEAGKSVKVEQKRFGDFFTPLVLSDLLSMQSDNDNGFILAQGKVEIPLWIKNTSKWSIFPNISSDFGALLFNGSKGGSGQKRIFGDVAVADTIIPLKKFDMIEFSNIRSKIQLAVFNYEAKGLGMDISTGYGLGYLRTGLNYSQVVSNSADIIAEDQLNSIYHNVFVKAQIRPQANFGADLNFSWNFLRTVGSKENFQYSFDSERKLNQEFVNLSLEIFRKVNPDESNGGIYARVGGFYHIESQDFFPQFFVGYASNLESFVNRFKKE